MFEYQVNYQHNHLLYVILATANYLFIQVTVYLKLHQIVDADMNVICDS